MSEITVPGDSSITINEAIKIANPGDTIVVAPGVYNEQVLINKENLTFLGAQANVDARTRIFVEKEESIITFESLEFGSGIINLLSPNITFNGFTVVKSSKDGTSAFFGGDLGTFPVSSKSTDVTGLKIINNIIQDNANGILIASIEPGKETSYLIQYNLFQNDNQGISFSNGTNININQNVFNSFARISLSNAINGMITDNVLNQDNSIDISNSDKTTISGNVMYESTGILLFENRNVNIEKNILFNSTKYGIDIFNGNSNIIITGNCVENSKSSGIVVRAEKTPNSDIIINKNNILGNNVGLLIDSGSYIKEMNSTDNYWGDSSGPNYNDNGPGKGDSIIDVDKNVIFEPFLSEKIRCPYPFILNQTTKSIDVYPGNQIYFNIELIVPENGVPFLLNSFINPLPVLLSGSLWTIADQNIKEFFTINEFQELVINDKLPIRLSPGIYQVTITAGTNIVDAGQIVNNIVLADIQIGGDTGLKQNFEADAEASLTMCIHSSSRVKLANGEEMEICQLKSGMQILSPDNTISPILEVIPCWAGIYGQIFTDCVIFEPHSLGPDVPNHRFAVDPGHPVCTHQEYLKGIELKPAKDYVNHNNIYLVKWNQVADLLPGENKRYDIVMTIESYIANNMVVKARKERKTPGYSYE